MDENEKRERRNAYQRKYRKRPEVKEKHLVAQREYQRRPEVRERLRKYRQRPEFKKRRREYMRKRLKDPERRDENRARAKEYSHRLRHDPESIIRNCQRQFAELCEKDPEESKELLAAIEAEEGPEFRELLLDGIPEKMKIIHQA